jgi:hypothetical protein
MKQIRYLAVFTCFALLASGWSLITRAQEPSVTVTHFATGLINPRGLKFGPDHFLYVAEGGFPTAPRTEAPTGLGGDCSVGSGIPGVYFGSPTGSRISRIDANGNVTTFVDNLPSSAILPPDGSISPPDLASGVADVAFIGNTMYAIFAGAGCSHGVFSSPGVPIPNGVIRINPDQTWTMIADLSAFQQTHPVANPTDPILGDFEPDGTWYSMIALRGDLYAVEPNHGELDKITTDGNITRVIDISASQGHVVPTVIDDHGVFYVSNLGQFDPDQLNTQDVFQITPSGNLKVVATGLSKVLGLAFDGRARLYVLETSYSTNNPGPVPGSGRLIRILPNGKQQILIDSTSGLLVVPTGITFGPNGALYISNVGFGAPPVGAGEILKVELTD